MDDLRLKLQRLRQFSRQDGSTTTLPFVPEADLYSLLTRDTLENALASPTFDLEPHQRELVAGEIIDGAQKIFAILVELRMEGKLKTCLEKCLMDSSLPIMEEKRLAENFPESALNFQKLQWEYVPLKFREHSHKDLESGCILPFVENTKLSSGGFSTVFKVIIHPLYQDWKPSTKTSVIELVRKEISSSTSYEAQRRESDLLFLLRSLKNVNIVRLVTSYTQNGFCNLLFPLADYDLHDLLLNSEQPKWTGESTQVVDSLRGLANGLHYLHNFRPLAKGVVETQRITKHGYHHDIKPRNILVKGTRLILADFGLARLKDMNEDTKTIWKNTPPTYGAPEACDPVTLQEKHIGRGYDIWSFGCILSEFATYALEGAAAVKTFRKEREKEGIYGRNNCFHHEGEVSPAVVTWLRKMEDRHRSSSMSLLFGISSKCLVGDPNERPKSEEVVQEFDYASLSRWLLSVLYNTFTMKNEAIRDGLSTVYLAKLTLERNRLRAWGYALGLEPFDQQMQPWIDQTSKDYDRICRVLKNCTTKLAELMNQNNEPDIQQRVLVLLTSANDSLLFGPPESVKVTIENTFQLLTVSTGKTVQLLINSADNSGALTSTDRATAQDQSTSQHCEAGLLAAARYMSLMLTSDGSRASEETVKIIEPSLIGEVPQHATYSSPLSIHWYYRGFRESDRQRVLVEERSYDSKWTSIPDADEFADRGKEVFDRVQELAKLFQMRPKPKDMRVLNCLGVYHLPALTKFGFVYEFPHLQQEEKDIEPVSLADLIRDTKDPERNPTLNDKFALSKAIASCVHSLHLTGWLHKSICSSNLIYFNKLGQDLTKLNLSGPYLTGFQHSRQSKPGAYSDGSITTKEMAFTHPSYQEDGARFHSAFDYYSLGVILLEIALWRPVDKIFPLGTSAETLRLLLFEYARKYIPQRMGTGYCDVVIACLDFYGNHIDEKKESSLLMKFQQEVLEKLQRASLPL